jgi:N-acetylneuraminate lyase
MKEWKRSHGLIAATFTPFKADGSVNYGTIKPYVDHLVKSGVTQVYVNGTAAEHTSLSVEERKKLAEEWVKEGKGKLTNVIVHCGTGNLVGTKELAAHAEQIGADCVAAIGPIYFNPSSVDALVDFIAEVAAVCPNTPFMYYHFPAITGINFRTTDVFKKAGERIPNFIGAKHTSTDLYDAGEAVTVNQYKYDVIIGAENMLIGAMAMGVESAIGITFSILGKTCTRMFNAFQKGDIETARKEQRTVIKFWSATQTPGDAKSMICNFKAILNTLGMDFGGCRGPIPTASKERVQQLKDILKELHFDKLEE